MIRVVEYYSDIYQHRDGLVGTLLLEGARNPDVAALIQGPLAAMSRLGEIFAGYQLGGQMIEEPTEFAVQALLAPLLVMTLLGHVTGNEVALPDASTVVQRFLKGRLLERADRGEQPFPVRQVHLDVISLNILIFESKPEGSPELMFLGTATTWHLH